MKKDITEKDSIINNMKLKIKSLNDELIHLKIFFNSIIKFFQHKVLYKHDKQIENLVDEMNVNNVLNAKEINCIKYGKKINDSTKNNMDKKYIR